MADGGGDQVQAALVGAWDGVAEADGVAGGEASRDADDAPLPAGRWQEPAVEAVMTASQSIHAIVAPAPKLDTVQASPCLEVPLAPPTWRPGLRSHYGLAKRRSAWCEERRELSSGRC